MKNLGDKRRDACFIDGGCSVYRRHSRFYFNVVSMGSVIISILCIV